MESNTSVVDTKEVCNHAEPIRRSIRHMQSHLAHKVALEEMASVACMSVFHYLRVFQRLTGVPPSRFFGALRLEAAKRLLLQTNRTVFDVCQDVGYSSLGTFSSRFAQLVGLAPAQFRGIYHDLRAGRTVTSLQRVQCQATPGRLLRGSFEHGLEANSAVFVGLFSSRIPQDMPLDCDIVVNGTEFQLSVPTGGGPYYVLGVALRPQSDFELVFDNRSLVGAVGASGPVETGDSSLSRVLRLRDPDLLDPPVLVAFPLLMHLKLGLANVKTPITEAPAAWFVRNPQRTIVSSDTASI